MILCNSNLWDFLFSGVFAMDYTMVPLHCCKAKVYPGLMQYSVSVLSLFIRIASLPMLKIMFSKIKKS